MVEPLMIDVDTLLHAPLIRKLKRGQLIHVTTDQAVVSISVNVEGGRPVVCVTAVDPVVPSVGERYLCERCGGTGIEPEGHWTGKAYDSVGGGSCTLCGGTGQLGVIDRGIDTTVPLTLTPPIK